MGRSRPLRGCIVLGERRTPVRSPRGRGTPAARGGGPSGAELGKQGEEMGLSIRWEPADQQDLSGSRERSIVSVPKTNSWISPFSPTQGNAAQHATTTSCSRGSETGSAYLARRSESSWKRISPGQQIPGFAPLPHPFSLSTKTTPWICSKIH